VIVVKVDYGMIRKGKSFSFIGKKDIINKIW
jgi:hypothetical protein